MTSMFATNQDTRNSLVYLESYTLTMTLQAKIEEKLLTAMSSINAIADLTDTKRNLIVLRAKIEAGSTDI